MELLKDVRFEIEKSFNEKLDNAKISEELSTELWFMVEDLIEEVQEKIRFTDLEIDNKISLFNLHKYNQDLKDDIRTQDYLERDLFGEE